MVTLAQLLMNGKPSNSPQALLERSKLILTEIEGLNSIHEFLSRKYIILLANQRKEIFIVI